MRALPYSLDLLVLMLRSGTSLRIALGRVIEDYQRHPLGIELGQVIAEIDVGSPRVEAFKKMAERLKLADIKSLVDAIVQSEELGWPLADTLERLADRINVVGVSFASPGDGGCGGRIGDAAFDAGADVGGAALVCAVYCEVSGDRVADRLELRDGKQKSRHG